MPVVGAVQSIMSGHWGFLFWHHGPLCSRSKRCDHAWGPQVARGRV